MAPRQSSPSVESHSDTVRKRVCKACDRCRLKKSKCDGGNPCGRCRTDNAICVFGERKKAHDKVYPKGYVEMLEQQQAWLVHGLQELYRRTNEGEGWPGEPLNPEPNGHPLTHDLLTRLGALDQTKGDHFEENTTAMQQDLWRHNVGYMQRQESSDGSSDSAQSPLISSRLADVFSRHQPPPTPPNYSPAGRVPPTLVKPEPPLTLHNGYGSIALPGVVDPITLQEPSPWATTAVQNGMASQHGMMTAFDEMELMTTTDYSGLLFDDAPITPSPIFSRMSGMPTLFDEDFR